MGIQSLRNLIGAIVILTCVAFVAGCGSQPRDLSTIEGRIGSLSIAVPENSVFIIDYVHSKEEESVRNCGSRIRGFVIFRRWPDFLPVVEDEEGFRRTYWSGMGESQWMDIGFKGREPQHPEGGAALWRLRGVKLGEILPGSRRNLKVVYDEQELVSGLSSALTIGPPTRRATRDTQASPEEYRIYWTQGRNEDQLNTVITCSEGAWLAAAGQVSRCEHQFFIEEFQVSATARYRANLLSEWSEIESGIRNHLATYSRECKQPNGAWDQR